MYSRQEILDLDTSRLELSVRTGTALKKRFGDRILIRELAMLSEKQIMNELRRYHKNPKIFVTDINAALSKHALSLGLSWAEMPPSKHTLVRNPRQMCAHVAAP